MKVSPPSRLPPGNSHNPPRWTPRDRWVMSNLPSRKSRAAATSMEDMAVKSSVMRASADHKAFRSTTGYGSRVTQASCHGSPAHAFVNKSQPLHLGRIKQIAAIKKNRVGEGFAGALQIQFLELRPFGGNDKSVAAFSDFVHLVDEGHIF